MGIGMYPKPSVAETRGKKCALAHLTVPIHIFITDEYTLMFSVWFYLSLLPCAILTYFNYKTATYDLSM